MMETPGGPDSSKPQNPQQEKKRPNRAPSPARPLVKDVHCRSNKPPPSTPRSPKLSPPAPVPPAHPTRSRRGSPGLKDKPAPVKSTVRPAAARKPARLLLTPAAPSPAPPKGKKAKVASGAGGPVPHGSPVRIPTGAATLCRQTDSSSDLSDQSEPLSDEQLRLPAAGSDAESGTGSSDRDRPRRAEAPAAAAPAARGGSKPATTTRPAGREAPEEELLHEMEELRSENDYLKVRAAASSVPQPPTPTPQ